MKAIVFLALSLVLALIPSAASCTPTSSSAVRIEGFYVANDVCQPSCLFSTWVYEESNGIPGLQRDDPGRMDETCGRGPDRLVF